MVKAPCLKCEDREIGCHSKCEAYLNYKGEIERIKKHKFKEEETTRAIREIRSKRR